MQPRPVPSVPCAQCNLPVAVRAARQNEPAFCCYGCALTFQIAGGRTEDSRASWLMSRLGLSLFLAMNVMMLSMILYTPQFFPRDTGSAGAFQEQFLSLTRYSLLVFATPVVLLLGLPILHGAWRAGLRLHFGVDALIAIGCFAAFGLSVHATFAGHEAVYYETATMVLVLVSFGRYLEARAKTSSTKEIQRLLAHDTPEAAAAAGAEIHVLPGATFPVDGLVVSGEGTVNEAMLTGESRPVVKHAGDRVFAGTTSFDGSFRVRVTAAGAERRIAKLARLLEQVRQSKSPTEKIADKVAGLFVPLAVTVAVGAFIFWAATDTWQRGLLNALSALLIACPCALGIATPLAIWNGIERAARRGIFVRNGEVLEKLDDVRSVFFDKTGTLTDGLPQLKRVELSPDAGADESALLQRVASLEQRSEHPLARAICAETRRRGLELLPVEDARVSPGRGISGRVGGAEVIVGSAAFVTDRGCKSNDSPRAVEGTAICCGWDGRIRARLIFGESARPDAAATVSALRQQKLSAVVLTGDGQSATDALARELNIEARGELSPEDKVRIVSESAARGATAMVGDGINDAPALGRACVGIALGGGTDVAREAADVTLSDNELTKLPWLFALARATRRTIRLNLFWAFVYNVVCLPVAAVGLLQPIWAAAAMMASSVLVVGNSMRLRRAALR